jgi:long-subunit acyl-CoA synthetase (AMP-forming)
MESGISGTNGWAVEGRARVSTGANLSAAVQKFLLSVGKIETFYGWQMTESRGDG